MKKVLVFAAVGEGATGLALLIVPSLVGQLLLGEELTGIAIPVSRVAGMALIALGITCWPGRTGHAVPCVSRSHRWFDRRFTVAGGCASRSSVNPSRSRLARRRGEIRSSHLSGQDRPWRVSNIRFWPKADILRVRSRVRLRG
jgi:hypothetical protein